MPADYNHTGFLTALNLVLMATLPVTGQEADRKVELSGYIKDLQNTWMITSSEWILWNDLHNRLNLTYRASDNISTNIGIRNNMVWGQLTSEFFKSIPGYLEMEEYDPGYLDLHWVPVHNHSMVLKTRLDRLNVGYAGHSFNIRAGRQRINWGTCLVWNPNDIFNSYSYFDFDYEERPGSDAIRLEYFTGTASSAELVTSLNHQGRPTFAGLYRFNLSNYDFQVLAGKTPDDYIAGLGWAGQISGAGFRGEATGFIPGTSERQTVFIASVDADYTFKNGFYLHAAGLYNSSGTTGNAGRGPVFMLSDLSVKSLTLARFSVFGQAGYPVSPVLTANLVSMYNPSDQSVFFSPSADVSLSDNLGFLALVQLFDGLTGTEFGGLGKILYFRFKYSF